MLQSGEPDVIFFAPRRSFCRTTAQRSEARLQVLPDWTRLLGTAFYSLPATARCRAPIGRLKLLACPFATLPNFASNPFGLPLLPRGPVRPGRGEFHTTNPLPDSRSSSFTRCLNLCSPSGFLGPSGSKLPPTHLAISSPLCPARFPFAPRWRSLLKVCRRIKAREPACNSFLS